MGFILEECDIHTERIFMGSKSLKEFMRLILALIVIYVFRYIWLQLGSHDTFLEMNGFIILPALLAALITCFEVRHLNAKKLAIGICVSILYILVVNVVLLSSGIVPLILKIIIYDYSVLPLLSYLIFAFCLKLGLSE